MMTLISCIRGFFASQISYTFCAFLLLVVPEDRRIGEVQGSTALDRQDVVGCKAKAHDAAVNVAL